MILFVQENSIRERGYSSPMKMIKTMAAWILRAEKDGTPYTNLDCFESGKLASKTHYREVSVSMCIIQSHAYEEEEEVRVARAGRFYRFRASACSRAAANCSLMQASERVAFLECMSKKSLDNTVNDENATLARILRLLLWNDFFIGQNYTACV